MADKSTIEWTDAPKGCRFGPAAAAPRDGDKRQARRRINVEVREGRRPHPNLLPCVDCGHVWAHGERRHEYDHHKGYGAAHHYDVISLCTTCHHKRDGKSARARCAHGHEFSAQNTRFTKTGSRVCMECRRAYDRSRSRPPGYWQAVNAKRSRRGG